MSSRGTWYTSAGEPADAWQGTDTPTVSEDERRTVLVAGSAHAMAGHGGGLTARLDQLTRRRPRSGIAKLL